MALHFPERIALESVLYRAFDVYNDAEDRTTERKICDLAIDFFAGVKIDFAKLCENISYVVIGAGAELEESKKLYIVLQKPLG